MNPEAEAYINKSKWTKELEQLRSILLDCGLTEAYKWRAPCYTHRNSNIALLASFKDFCALSFVKGVLLLDDQNILQAPGKNSQSVRLVKFTSLREIVPLENTLKTYIYEAIENENSGIKVEFKEKSTLHFPEELIQMFEESAELKSAFEALTPGRQRAFNLHFTQAKQRQTRITRIEKSIPRIVAGKGPNDCICGLSKRKPNCDGSHKHLQISKNPMSKK